MKYEKGAGCFISRCLTKNAAIITETGKAAKTIKKVFSYLESSPVIDIKRTSEKLGLSCNATANVVNKLVDLKILIKAENIKRNRAFSYDEYLSILRSDI